MEQEAGSPAASLPCTSPDVDDLPMPFSAASAKRPLECALASGSPKKQHKLGAVTSSLPNSVLPRIRTTILPTSSSVESDSVAVAALLFRTDGEHRIPEAELAGRGMQFATVADPSSPPYPNFRSCQGNCPSPPEPCTPRATTTSTSIFTPDRQQPVSLCSSPQAVSQSISALAKAMASAPLSSPTSSLGVPDRMMSGRNTLLSSPAPSRLFLPPTLKIRSPRPLNPPDSTNTLPWAHLTPSLSLHIPHSAPKLHPVAPATAKSPLPSASPARVSCPSSARASLSPVRWMSDPSSEVVSHHCSPTVGLDTPGSSSAVRCSQRAPSRFSQVQIRREAQLGFVLAASIQPNNSGSGALDPSSAPTPSQSLGEQELSRLLRMQEENTKNAYRENVKRAFNQWLDSMARDAAGPVAGPSP